MTVDPGIIDTHPAFERTATRWNAVAARTLLAYLVVGGLVLAPLFLVTVPALVDYPNHLARMAILAHPHGAAALNYVAHWQLLPTLAMDLVVPALAQVMPIELAGRVFIGVTLVLLLLGTAALHRALWGRVGLWPLAAALFLYNDAFYWGLLNYLFGLGVALLGFSAWIATARRRASPRLLAFALLAGVLFVLHLFAFGVYGLLVASYEIAAWRRDGRTDGRAALAMLARFAQFLPPALLWLGTLSSGGPRYTAYGGVMDKLMALTSPMVFGDVGFVVVPICLGLIYLGWRTRRLVLAPAMRLPVAVLVVAAALMPNWLFGSWAADVRLPIALSFIVIAGTELRLPRRVGYVAAAAALLFLGARTYAMAQDWRDMDRHYAEFRAATASLPEGARLLVVQSPIPDEQRIVAGIPPFLMARQSPDFFHMAALSVIDRGTFVPYLFTGWTTVEPTARNAGLYQSQGVPLRPEQLEAGAGAGGDPDDVAPDRFGVPPYWRDWPDKFDFVLWLDFGTDGASPSLPLEPWGAGSFFHLYRIKSP